MTPVDLPTTLGGLRALGAPAYRPVKEEMRQNLSALLARGEKPEAIFPGLHGYADTVLPMVINAILAGHDLLLLGLRGQAKTRLARSLTRFLDGLTPVLKHDPLRSHPTHPVGDIADGIIAEHGDKAEIEWLPNTARYGEKLATPDVSVSDLIGDIDPIRAHREGFDLGDARSITFGIIPRTNRGIFCINELPDLSPRIQVSLFNILEEQDMQIRGIPLRIPLDIMLVFTANPEDYTSRGQIITPLKDRIGSQILTHYPRDRAIGIEIMQQEASLVPADARCRPVVPALFSILIEEAARAARISDYVDTKSGVSARLTISALELLHATVQRRGLINREAEPLARLIDLPATLAAIVGKIELAYEGQEEGALKVARHILGEAVRTVWKEMLPPVLHEGGADERDQGPWKHILEWFANHGNLEISDHSPTAKHESALEAVPGLAKLSATYIASPTDQRALWQEFIIEGLFQGGVLAREELPGCLIYSDLLKHMINRGDGRKKRQA